MKRHWYTYLLGLCAMLWGSCAESDMQVAHTPEEATSREVPICFVSSFVDHAVTRHANELCEHLSTMGVWGWSTGAGETVSPLFLDQKVVHNPDSARWEYSPLQYWQEKCQYAFCAYAPHQQDTECEVSIDSLTRLISITGVTLHGYNLQDTPTDTVKECFRNSPDIDWMVARAGQKVIGLAGTGVEFTMQHILAKLNVCIKVDSTLMRKCNISHITADSIVVGTLAAQGNFNQQLKHTPVLIDPAETAINEWTVSDTTLYIKGSHEIILKDAPTYLVESLVFPQYISPSATVTLYYSYHFSNGRKEECRYRMTLTDAFTRFASGYNYKLTFTLCPQRIIFDAGANQREKV